MAVNAGKDAQRGSVWEKPRRRKGTGALSAREIFRENESLRGYGIMLLRQPMQKR
ncbi:hypothetical protein SAMN05216420_101129 [Nitrosospira sp. Nl5]|nr:hypothetical protein SAMN05216420_101129 [Nitrosospira sp. Nl5]